MKTKLFYEWDYETTDEHGDIIDHNHRERLADFREHDVTDDLVLVRDVCDINGTVDERSWAYVTNGELPTHFADALGQKTEIKVPQRFHKELATLKKELNIF